MCPDQPSWAETGSGVAVVPSSIAVGASGSDILHEASGITRDFTQPDAGLPEKRTPVGCDEGVSELLYRPASLS